MKNQTWMTIAFLLFVLGGAVGCKTNPVDRLIDTHNGSAAATTTSLNLPPSATPTMPLMCPGGATPDAHNQCPPLVTKKPPLPTTPKIPLMCPGGATPDSNNQCPELPHQPLMKTK
jgi:hypothetical protein